jgi:hypothetical protein
MRHYPKTPDDERWQKFSSTVSITIAVLIMVILKSCGQHG